MQRQPRSDTSCEREIASALKQLGARFATNCRVESSCRRRADFVFRSARVAVFVDGCFWHGCRTHFRPPITNAEWWAKKIERNRDRDAATSALLRQLGWRIVRVWEHSEPSRAALRVMRAVRTRTGRSITGGRRGSPSPRGSLRATRRGG